MTAVWRRDWFVLGAPFVVALSLRLLYVLSRYTPELGAFEFGDYPSYAFAARFWLQTGTFASDLFLVRPLAFPVLIALLGEDKLAVLLVNCALGALIASLTALLCLVAFKARAVSLLAGMIVALDPAGVVYSAFLAPEPLANLSLAVMIVCVYIGVTRKAWLWLGLAGVALSASMLARPAAYLLWLPLTVLIGLFAWRQRRLWIGLALFALLSGGAMAAWIAHNARVFNHATFSTIGVYTMLYYRAAMLERLATGADIETVYARLAERVEARLARPLPEGVDIAGARFTHFAATPEMSAAMTEVAFEVFRRYPHLYLLTVPLGLARMYGHTQPLSGIWSALDVLWNIGLVALSAVGVLLLWRHQQRLLVGMTLLIGVYFTIGALLVKTTAIDTRERSMLTPLLACCAAYALSWLKRQKARAQRYDESS